MPADEMSAIFELGISCRVDFRQVYIAINATLSPNSFIHSCRFRAICLVVSRSIPGSILLHTRATLY